MKKNNQNNNQNVKNVNPSKLAKIVGATKALKTVNLLASEVGRAKNNAKKIKMTIQKTKNGKQMSIPLDNGIASSPSLNTKTLMYSGAAIGTAALGLALAWRWNNNRRQQAKTVDSKVNDSK